MASLPNNKGIKPGDTIKFRGGCNSAKDGQEYVVQVDPSYSNQSSHEEYLGVGADIRNLCHCLGQWTLVDKTNTNNKTMSIINKAKLAFKGEPEKSFIKAGVIDSSENLTAEGQTVFLNWLLKKHGLDFKKEVIDPIMA